MSSKLQSKAAGETSPLGFLRRQFTKQKPLPAGTKLTNHVAIVTGSNVGLGLEASRQFLQLGLAHLIMGVRSQSKGDAAATKLRKEFPSAQISVWLLDMTSYDSIHAFVEKCATLPRIDIAVLNAGLMSSAYAVVPGPQHETTLQVNYLSTVMLAVLLVPLMKAKRAPEASRPPVLSIVGSDLVYSAKINAKAPIFQQFDDKTQFDGFPLYGKSKLLLLPFLTKLAELVSADDVLVNVSNPGMTKGTAFFRDAPPVMQKVMGVLAALLARSVAVGASIYVHAVVAEGKDSHGSFVSDWAIKPFPKMMYEPVGREFQEHLWEETVQALESAGVKNVVQSLAGKGVA